MKDMLFDSGAPVTRQLGGELLLAAGRSRARSDRTARVDQCASRCSKQVLTVSLDSYYYPFVIGHFPGLAELPAEAQVVLVSLVFNRGISMGHEPDWRFAREVDSRWEFRELRRDVQEGDLFGIYAHLETMKRLWEKSGPRGLRIRRRDEQALIRPYVNKQLEWEQRCKP